MADKHKVKWYVKLPEEVIGSVSLYIFHFAFFILHWSPQ
jgi:hypothetical protein